MRGSGPPGPRRRPGPHWRVFSGHQTADFSPSWALGEGVPAGPGSKRPRVERGSRGSRSWPDSARSPRWKPTRKRPFWCS